MGLTASAERVWWRDLRAMHASPPDGQAMTTAAVLGHALRLRKDHQGLAALSEAVTIHDPAQRRLWHGWACYWRREYTAARSEWGLLLARGEPGWGYAAASVGLARSAQHAEDMAGARAAVAEALATVPRDATPTQLYYLIDVMWLARAVWQLGLGETVTGSSEPWSDMAGVVIALGLAERYVRTDRDAWLQRLREALGAWHPSTQARVVACLAGSVGSHRAEWLALAATLAADPVVQAEGEAVLRLRALHSEDAQWYARQTLAHVVNEPHSEARWQALGAVLEKGEAELLAPHWPVLIDPGCDDVMWRQAIPAVAYGAAQRGQRDSLVGHYGHGHRHKNRLGIVGARVRGAKKAAERLDAHFNAEGDASVRQRFSEVIEKMTAVESEVNALFDDWGAYLRSVEPPRLQREPFALGDFVAEVVESTRTRNPAAAIQCTLAPTAHPPVLIADRSMLREALFNVLGNCVDACQRNQGTVALSVSLQPSGAGQAGIVFDIEDTGVGMDHNVLAQLFTPGFTTKPNGSGLGLVVAQQIVRAHDGILTIDSTVGVGTRVRVWIPLAATAAARGELP